MEIVYPKRKNSFDRLTFLYKDFDTIKFQSSSQAKIHFQNDLL